MTSHVRVAILEDHQSIIDGYCFRLSSVPQIKIVGQAYNGAELEELLQKTTVDVLLLDLNVPVSEESDAPIPVLHLVPTLLERYPRMGILVITMLDEAALIRALVDVGIRGYISKEDSQSIQQLGRIVTMVANGGIYFSQSAYRWLRGSHDRPQKQLLTLRQMEALSLCSAFPDDSTKKLAERMGISSSTLRNLLSAAYVRLGVRTRMAAILKARELGILTSIQEKNAER